RIGQLTPAIGPYVPAPGLRPDDLIFIVVGAVPGALIGGRPGYVLAHLDFYHANPSPILDPGQGAWELTLAVPLAIVTGSLIARRDGGAMFAALALWAGARFLVGFTWRDPTILGPLRAEQLLAVLLLMAAVVGLAERRRAPIVVLDTTGAAIEADRED